MLQKVDLSLFTAPPSGQEVFEIYFKEDIFPFIRHGIQSKITNKKVIHSLWDIQSNMLQKIYCDRSDLLKTEWAKRMKSKESIGKSHLTKEEEEAMRKKQELKAKKEAAKLRRKEEMERLISSGAFDEPKAPPKVSSKKKKKEKAKKSEKKKAKKSEKKKKEQEKEERTSKAQKQQKAPKKKKIKKWKDKKSKKQSTELWPAIKSKAKTSPKSTPQTKQLNLNTNSNANSNGKPNVNSNGKSNVNSNGMNEVLSSQPIRNGVDPNMPSNHSLPHSEVHSAHSLPLQNGYGPLHGHHGVVEHHHGHHPVHHHQSERNGHSHHLERHRNERIHRKMIRSSLRFKLLVRGESDEYVVGSGPDIHRQIEGLKLFMDGMQSLNDLQCIKIWIFCDLNVAPGQEIWLCTDREQVNVTLNQSKLFEILWSDFGHAVKRRIDSANIKVMFMKNLRCLRLKIPFYSL